MGTQEANAQEIIALTARTKYIGELETGLNRMVQAFENTRKDSDGRYPLPDMGCPDCTENTVPDSLNTGPCAYHNATRLLGHV